MSSNKKEEILVKIVHPDTGGRTFTIGKFDGNISGPVVSIRGGIKIDSTEDGDAMVWCRKACIGKHGTFIISTDGGDLVSLCRSGPCQEKILTGKFKDEIVKSTKNNRYSILVPLQI
jgi:hypothetical protein